MQQGRTPPPERLEEWTSPETGRTVQIRKVSTLIRAEIRRQLLADPAFAEPQPPESEVDYGNGTVRVPNRAHPTYLELHRAWAERLTLALSDRLKTIALRRGVVVADDAIDRDAVAAVRAELADVGTPVTEERDRDVYVKYVVVGSETDYGALLAAIFDRSAPSEAAVQAHIATFPGTVRGQGSVEPEPGPASGEDSV